MLQATGLYNSTMRSGLKAGEKLTMLALISITRDILGAHRDLLFGPIVASGLPGPSKYALLALVAMAGVDMRCEASKEEIRERAEIVKKPARVIGAALRDLEEKGLILRDNPKSKPVAWIVVLSSLKRLGNASKGEPLFIPAPERVDLLPDPHAPTQAALESLVPFFETEPDSPKPKALSVFSGEEVICPHLRKARDLAEGLFQQALEDMRREREEA